MRKFFAIAFVLFFASAVSALTVEAPSQIPAYSNFSVTAKFDSTDTFDQAIVQLDGQAVATVFPTANGSGTISESDTDTGKVLGAALADDDKASKGGLKIVVSLAGLSAGSHNIKAVELKAGSTVQEQQANINSFQPLDESFRADALQKIDSLSQSLDEQKSKNDALATENSSLKSKVSELENSLNQKQAEVESISGSLRNLQSRISSTESAVEEQKTQNEETSAKVGELEARTAGPLENVVNFLSGQKEQPPAGTAAAQMEQVPDENAAQNSNILTGLVGAVESNSMTIIGLAVLIVVSVLAIMHFTKRESIYADSGNKEWANENLEDALAAKDKELESQNAPKKWHAKEAPAEDESKKGTLVRLSDMFKKK